MKIKPQSKKALCSVVLTWLLAAIVCSAVAQTETFSVHTADSTVADGFSDSAARAVTNPVYFGYEITAAVQQHTLTSAIDQINNLLVTCAGGRLGVKLSNSAGGVKAFVGLYYSGENIPYTIDLLEGGLSGNLYLLRLRKKTYHTFEPYVVAGVAYQQAKFYGTFLDSENRNNSVSEEPFLSNVNWIHTTVGAGAEYQLENSKLHFLHFFAEVLYGRAHVLRASADAFGGTRAHRPVSFALGVCFGKFKERAKK